MAPSKSITTVYTEALSTIPAAKRNWGWQVVVVPCIGTHHKSTSTNGAKSVVMPGGFITVPGVNPTTGIRKNPFMGSNNITVIANGKLYKRGGEDTPFNFRLTSLTTPVLTQTLAGYVSAEDLADMSTADMVGALQELLVSRRGQLHIVCYDSVQGKVVEPTKNAQEIGEMEEFIVHPQQIFSIRFVEETSTSYLHRVDMPESVNSRYLGSEISADDKPQVVDALAPRAINRKQIVRAMEQLIKEDPGFLKSATLEQVQERIGSKRKEVEELFQQFLNSTSTEDLATEPVTEAIAKPTTSRHNANTAAAMSVGELLDEAGF